MKTATIQIALIDVGEQQIRETPEDDAIGELAESIASKGLLQPIGVTTTPDGRYQLRWGHRRLLAHQRLQRPTIQASVYDGSEGSIKGIALVENLHRSAMTMRDEVEAVTYLAKEEQKTVEQIAAIVNKGRAWVLNRLMVDDLPEYLKEPLLAGDLPISHVEVIAQVPDDGAKRYLTQNCIMNRWNKSQLKTIADCYQQPLEQQAHPGEAIPGVNPQIGAQVFLYTCEVCQQKDKLETFTLVRVHKDGYGCRATPDRPDNEGGSVNGLDSDRNVDGNRDDQNHHRKAETAVKQPD